MRHTKSRHPIILSYFLGMALFFSFCTPNQQSDQVMLSKPIKQSEITAFQKAYGISFNAISNAVEDNSYYETAALKHIDKFYNFSEGKVMVKIGHSDDEPYRYTSDGLLSYLIGKNSQFPNDSGIAKDNWRKMEWKNDGIISDDNDVAIVMGKVKMTKPDNQVIDQVFTMCLKRNKAGELKLIAHKIALPCNLSH